MPSRLQPAHRSTSLFRSGPSAPSVARTSSRRRSYSSHRRTARRRSSDSPRGLPTGGTRHRQLTGEPQQLLALSGCHCGKSRQFLIRPQSGITSSSVAFTLSVRALHGSPGSAAGVVGSHPLSSRVRSPPCRRHGVRPVALLPIACGVENDVNVARLLHLLVEACHGARVRRITIGMEVAAYFRASEAITSSAVPVTESLKQLTKSGARRVPPHRPEFGVAACVSTSSRRRPTGRR